MNAQDVPHVHLQRSAPRRQPYAPKLQHSASRCAPPKTYSSTQLLALAAAACETGGGGSSVGWSWAEAEQGKSELARACDAIDVLAAAEYAACSPHARATFVVHALLADGGGIACCDTIYEEGPPTYAVRLLCRRGPRALWGALAPSLLLGAVVVLVLRGACRSRAGAATRRTMWSTRGEQLAAAVRDTISVAPQDEEGRDRDILLSEADDSREQLASLLLWHLSEEARAERLAMMSAVGRALGFQASNVANQAEHLESLLLSHLSMTHGHYARAVAALHAKLLQPFERWCAHTAVVDGEAEVRPELGRTNAWRQVDQPELLREIGLYLLLWGEAANLRFMPEMLCFLFELARSSSAIQGLQSLRMQATTPLPFKGTSASAAAAAASSDAAATTAGPEEGTFLRNVVVPIYNVVVGETSSGVDAKGRPKPLEGAERPAYPKNYDDWNQATSPTLTLHLTLGLDPEPRPPNLLTLTLTTDPDPDH